jgi:glutaconate CoA-transferase subunit B
MGHFSLQEMYVIEASRYIEDYETVFAGTGLPIVCTMFAQKCHAPHLCFVVETGPIAPILLPTPLSVSDSRVQYKAVRLGSLREVLGSILQRGLCDVGFLGGAEIDQYGNINSTVIGDYNHPKVRFPGSGGANDIASHSKKILIITRHEKRRFPEKCNYVTSPGYIDGPDGRKKAGLSSPCPILRIITDIAVMESDPGTGRLKIVKLMPGCSVEDVFANTGFRPDLAKNIEAVKPPSKAELRILREQVDPYELYIKMHS